MPLFITYASYSNTGIKGIIDKPIDRTEPIRTLVEKAGGKLIAAYMTTGPYDVVIVTEQADGSDAVAVGMAAAASGAVAKIETVRAWTLGEFKGISEKASRFAEVYVPPGRFLRAESKPDPEGPAIRASLSKPPTHMPDWRIE